MAPRFAMNQCRRQPCAPIGRAVLAATIMAASIGCTQSKPGSPTDPAVRARTFDFVWQTLHDHDPLLSESGADWDSQRERRDSAIAAEPIEFYGIICGMVASLGDPHTNFSLSDGAQREPWGTVGVWGLVDRRLILLGEDATIGSTNSTAYPVLESVDGASLSGERMGQLLVAHHPHRFHVGLLNADGTHGERAMDSLPMHPTSVTASFEEAQRAVTVHPALMSGTRLAAPCTFRYRIDHPGEMPDRPWAGSCANPFIHAEPPDRVALLHNPPDAPHASGELPWWLDAQDLGEVGYLRISTVNAELTGLTGSQTAYVIRAAIDRLRHRDKFIIDLRYNYGGTVDVVCEVLPFLLKRTLTTRAPGYQRVRVHPDAYRGKISVLVNARTFSGGEWLAAILRSHADAVLIGELTGGAELGTETVTAPDGSTLQYSAHRLVDFSPSGFQGNGITPNVELPLTLDRVRQIGFAAAIHENEMEQFRAACEALGIDASKVIRSIAPE